MQHKVRRCLAYSLHELAKLLGSHITESQLLPVFHSFLRDVEEVRLGVIRSLAAFFRHLTASVRHQQVSVLLDIAAENDHQWRMRQLLAKFVVVAVAVVASCLFVVPAD